MAALQNALVTAGRRAKATDQPTVSRLYLDHCDLLGCALADDGGTVLGFQALLSAEPGNPYDTPAGWGIVGTHVHPDVIGTGIGRKLFDHTRRTAQAAGLPCLEAYIGADNDGARAYYHAMGFRTWRRPVNIDAKAMPLADGVDLTPPPDETP